MLWRTDAICFSKTYDHVIRPGQRALRTVGKDRQKDCHGHIYRYLPVVGLVRDDIAKGVFGKVTHGTIYVRWGHGEDYYSSSPGAEHGRATAAPL